MLASILLWQRIACPLEAGAVRCVAKELKVLEVSLMARWAEEGTYEIILLRMMGGREVREMAGGLAAIVEVW